MGGNSWGCQPPLIFALSSPILHAMGEMKRAIARENEERQKSDRFLSTLVISASIIAAIRLAREPDITRPTPRLYATISDSISLARSILNRIVR